MAEHSTSSPTLNNQVWRLRCIGCGSLTDTASQNFRCTHCGDLLEVYYPGWFGAPGAGISTQKLKSTWLERRTSFRPEDQSGVWRFRELLPSLKEGFSPITLREGSTPVYELSSCARAIGLDQLWAKHQGMNPTGSFKDTGMTVAASVARQEGFRWVACASTGNTSASMAAYASRGGMRSLVLIPEGKISWGKLSQALDYGAVTCQLRTDFDGCMQVLSEVVQRLPVYLLNSVNPYRLEGQKTAAIELLEQLGWTVPDHIIVPGGNLGNSSALGKALLELRDLGLISRLPKLSIIQAAGANPLVRMIRSKASRLEPIPAETLATAIRIGNPASWKKALRVLQQTSGTVEEATEVEIAEAKAQIGADGIGCEPASAVTLVGARKLLRQGFIGRGEQVVLVLTGHLLKDPEFTLKFHRGELFADSPHAGQAKALALLQRAPILLEANAGAVVKVLEAAERQPTR